MRRELTWQAVVAAVIVAALVSASYPYILLKLGIGPNVSVVSAFLGAILLLALAPQTHGQNRLMNNIVQTAGTSASMTAFMCVIAAAVDLTAQNPLAKDNLDGLTHIDPWPMFLWLSCAGGIGVLFTALFRRHFLDDPKMVFADGVAAAETIVVLDSRGREATGKIIILGLAAAASALVYWLRAEAKKLETYFFSSAFLKSFGVGIEWNLMTMGTGLLVGINVALSALAGTLIVAWAGSHLIDEGVGRKIVLDSVAPEMRSKVERLIDKEWDQLSKEEQAFVEKHGGRQKPYMEKNYFQVLILWFMWPATGLMIASALTAVCLKWRSVVESFKQMRIQGNHNREDVSLKTVIIGTLFLAVALAVIQEQNFGLSYLQTGLAIVCVLPLVLVGIRVLGETNFGPISIMMNGLQAIFAVFWPANIGHNLVAAGTAGTCNAQGEGTIQDYKTGQLIGSTPRVLTWVQLAAVPIGAAAVAIMYGILVERYGTPGSPDSELTAPPAIRISNMGVLLSKGVEALPEGALLWTAVAAAAGILVVLAQHFFRIGWLPSATGLGLGFILPGGLILPMAVGGIVAWVWEKAHRRSWEQYGVTVASGFIGGEAILGGLFMPLYQTIKEQF
jgi:uncharacterized oligopeptide transporter (OPT) family protein